MNQNCINYYNSQEEAYWGIKKEFENNREEFNRLKKKCEEGEFVACKCGMFAIVNGGACLIVLFKAFHFSGASGSFVIENYDDMNFDDSEEEDDE
jgi:hypothetical protein